MCREVSTFIFTSCFPFLNLNSVKLPATRKYLVHFDECIENISENQYVNVVSQVEAKQWQLLLLFCIFCILKPMKNFSQPWSIVLASTIYCCPLVNTSISKSKCMFSFGSCTLVSADNWKEDKYCCKLFGVNKIIFWNNWVGVGGRRLRRL